MRKKHVKNVYHKDAFIVTWIEAFVRLVCKLRGRDIYRPECALWLGLLSVITGSLGAS